MNASAAVARNQREIDALLGGTAPSPAAEPRPWTLARALPASRAQRARLDGVHTRFARSLEVHLAAALQMPVEVRVAGSERIPAAELLAAGETPAAAFGVRVAGTEGPDGLMDLGADFALALVERLLGGRQGAPVARRSLTSFEQALLRGLVERALTLLGESWSAVEPTRFECGAYHSDPALGGIAEGEVMLATHFEIAWERERCDVVLALPVAAMGARVQEVSAGGTRGDDAWLEQQLRRANADVRVRFPEMRVTTRALAALQPGQVLDTRHPADAAFEIRINGRVRFRGPLGQVRSHLGVRIGEVANEADGDSVGRPLEGRMM